MSEGAGGVNWRQFSPSYPNRQIVAPTILLSTDMILYLPAEYFGTRQGTHCEPHIPEMTTVPVWHLNRKCHDLETSSPTETKKDATVENKNRGKG